MGYLCTFKSVAMPVTVIIKHSQLLTIIARGRVWVTFVVLLGGKFGRSEVTSSWRVGVLIANSLPHMKAEWVIFYCGIFFVAMQFFAVLVWITVFMIIFFGRHFELIPKYRVIFVSQKYIMSNKYWKFCFLYSILCWQSIPCELTPRLYSPKY